MDKKLLCIVTSGVAVPAVSGLLLFASVACTPQEPAGLEPPPAVAEETAVTPGSGENTIQEPATSAPEALALRFVSPNIGPAAGGNDVTIDGRGFGEYPRIAFGGVPAWIRSVTPTEIRVTVPPPEEPVTASTLTVDVTVINPPQGSEGPVSETLARSYSYVDAAAGLAAKEDAPEPPPAGEAPPAVTEVAAGGTASTPIEQATTPEPTLVASFSFEILTDSEDCPPPSTSIRFTDRSTGSVTEWWWEFGDGRSARERHPEHCYSVPGMRSVTLIVSNAEESATTSKIVTAGME